MNIAIILSGGKGNRMRSDIPKQYLDIKGKPIILYTLEHFIENKNIQALIIAVDLKWKDFLLNKLKYVNIPIPIYFSLPGETRQYTIYNALKVAEDLYGYSDTILIHDAVRPLVSSELIDACIDACKENDGVMPILPLRDTIYESMDGISISSIPNREVLFAGQTPEAFHLGKYISAHESMSYEDLKRINGCTELAYKAGLRIKMIRGEEQNFKVTFPDDLIRLKLLL